jgi:hypothetical protein
MSQVKTEKQAVDLRATAKTHAEAVTRAALVLAETLFEIKFSSVKLAGREQPLVESWGHEDFHEYAEHELGMHGSTAEAYVHVHDVLILGEGIAKEDLPPSITKLIQLAKVAKRQGENVKAWIKKAKESSCCEFQALVDEALTGKITHRNYAFWMANRDIKNVERGIKRAKEILGTKHNGETLSQIVSEWCVAAESNKLRHLKRVG